MIPVIAVACILSSALTVPALIKIEQGPAPSRPASSPAKPSAPIGPEIDVVASGLTARFDSVANPPAPRSGYKIGQRVVFTIWIDNDDPYDGMRDLVIQMPRLPAHMRLDVTPDQPVYGNIFTDSAFPHISDTPAGCRLYYVSSLEGETRPLRSGIDPASIRDVFWVITRGNSEQVIGPHNANDNMWDGDKADVRYGVLPDADQMYVRYAVLVVAKPAKPAKKSARSSPGSK